MPFILLKTNYVFRVLGNEINISKSEFITQQPILFLVTGLTKNTRKFSFQVVFFYLLTYLPNLFQFWSVIPRDKKYKQLPMKVRGLWWMGGGCRGAGVICRLELLFQPWADANIFASSCFRHESLLRMRWAFSVSELYRNC